MSDPLLIDKIDVALWWMSATSGGVFIATLLYWAIGLSVRQRRNEKRLR